MNIEYSKITDNPEVIKLLKQRIELENKIKAIDEMALINHELELLSLPDVGKSVVCDYCKGMGRKYCGVPLGHIKCPKCGKY